MKISCRIQGQTVGIGDANADIQSAGGYQAARDARNAHDFCIALIHDKQVTRRIRSQRRGVVESRGEENLTHRTRSIGYGVDNAVAGVGNINQPRRCYGNSQRILPSRSQSRGVGHVPSAIVGQIDDTAIARVRDVQVALRIQAQARRAAESGAGDAGAAGKQLGLRGSAQSAVDNRHLDDPVGAGVGDEQIARAVNRDTLGAG